MGMDQSYWDSHDSFFAISTCLQKEHRTLRKKKKAETIFKLLENWLKLIIIFVLVVHIFCTGMDGVRYYFLHTRTYRLGVTVRWSGSQQLKREAKGAKAKLFLYLQGQRRRWVKKKNIQEHFFRY